MAGFNCNIRYLKGKGNVCADLLSRAVGAGEDHEDPPVDIYDRNYRVRAINSNLFESKQFASHKNDDDSSVMYERPTLPGIDIIREQESGKNIFDPKGRIKNGRDTKTEQEKIILMH